MFIKDRRRQKRRMVFSPSLPSPTPRVPGYIVQGVRGRKKETGVLFNFFFFLSLPTSFAVRFLFFLPPCKSAQAITDGDKSFRGGKDIHGRASNPLFPSASPVAYTRVPLCLYDPATGGGTFAAHPFFRGPTRGECDNYV